MKRKKTWWAGLALILLSCGLSIFWGISLVQQRNRWVDFRAVYYGTRCLLEGRNPYKVSELEDVYRAEGGERPWESARDHAGVTLYVNLPTTFLLAAPLALLPWGAAHVLWVTFTALAFLLAALLAWNLKGGYAPGVALFLMCMLLANCEAIFAAGNTAGIVVSLCIVAVWCFLRERFVPIGVLCMAVSLAVKPHDAGLIWLYFLLAGEPRQKRALQTLLVTVVLGLLAFLWVSHVAPGWAGDWHANMTSISAHGGLNDPNLNSIANRGAGMVVDLQSAISVFRDDSRIYNPASYLICGALLLVWLARTLKLQFSHAGAWLALAAVVPLTLLVTYHRPYDAKLLLLTIPACAMLWAEGGAIAWIALLLNGAAIMMTADVLLTIFMIFANIFQIPATGVVGQILTVVLMRPLPLILLAMSIFYLWIYVRRDPARMGSDPLSHF